MKFPAKVELLHVHHSQRIIMKSISLRFRPQTMPMIHKKNLFYAQFLTAKMALSSRDPAQYVQASELYKQACKQNI